MAGRHEKCLHCNDSSGAVSSLKLWLLTFARRWLCARVTANIAPTQSLADTLRLPRTVVIHHGLPAGQPAPLTGPGSEVTTVAFIGRLVTAKGAHLLLEATALLAAKGARVHVRIIGDGPERERLQARAQTLGLMDRVAFLGYVSDERLPEALANVSAIIMPSLGGEVFGLVAAETMLRERCIVSSDLPSLTEVVGDGGLIFPAGDVRGLAACLQQLFERPALPAQLGRQARQRALQLFSLERMVTHHVALYRQVLAT
jgi:glycosyltransferase involved in cell wall biosynthesis